MADSTNFNPMGLEQPVVETIGKTKRPSRTFAAGRVFAWIGLMVAGILSLIPISRFSSEEVATWSLKQADAAAITRALEQDWPRATAPDYLETLAELGLQLPTPDTSSAYVAAQRVTRLDPSRGYAWAELAYLEFRKAGQVNAPTTDALTKSMDVCPLCSEDLVRWRFNFVLANWAVMPEAMRRRAFEQADLLRWIGPNAEFLAEMRIKSQQNGIPFDAYRAAVNTPVRTWDIGPAPQARATLGAPPA